MKKTVAHSSQQILEGDTVGLRRQRRRRRLLLLLLCVAGFRPYSPRRRRLWGVHSPGRGRRIRGSRSRSSLLRQVATSGSKLPLSRSRRMRGRGCGARYLARERLRLSTERPRHCLTHADIIVLPCIQSCGTARSALTCATQDNKKYI